MEEDIKMPAKLTQRDSGLADSIEPDSTESRRQSVTPEQMVVHSPEKELTEYKVRDSGDWINWRNLFF